MITIGVDPSLTGTGVVVLEDGKMVAKHLIKTKRKGLTPRDEVERLEDIVEAVGDILDEYQPDAVCMEGLAFMARNTSALVQLSALNYMLRQRFSNHIAPCDWYIVAPSSLKKFVTGAGNSAKEVMMMETYKRYGVTLSDNNECDAYGLAQVGAAIMGAHSRNLNKTQKEVVTLLGAQKP